MKEETTDGIVLRSVAVQEGRHILTVFTPQEGLISLATPRISIHEMRLTAATALLSRSEFSFRKKSSDIYRLLEASQLENFDGLRSQFSHLTAAGDLLHLILRSQMPGRAAPLLYELLLTYLRRLTRTANLACLIASFRLKLLKHEGLFAWTPAIPHHVQELASFTEEEWQNLGIMLGSRSFTDIENIAVTPRLPEQITALFEKLIR